MPRGVNGYDEARLQRRLWTPTALGPLDIPFWFDADDPRTLTVASGVVSSWVNKGGFSVSVTNSGSAQPAYTPNGLNGRPVLAFDGSNDCLLSTNVFMPASNSLVFLAVVSHDTGSNYRCIFGANTGAVSGYAFGFILAGAAGDFQAGDLASWGHGYGSGSTPQSGQNGSGLVAGGGFHLLRVELGTNSSTRIDGSSVTARVTQNSTSASTFLSFAIGNENIAGSAPWPGKIAEIIILDDLPVAVADKAEGYLAWKYGLIGNLDRSHPYKNRPPLIGV